MAWIGVRRHWRADFCFPSAAHSKSAGHRVRGDRVAVMPPLGRRFATGRSQGDFVAGLRVEDLREDVPCLECVALDLAAEERAAPFAAGGAAGTGDAPVTPLDAAPAAGAGSGGGAAETRAASTVSSAACGAGGSGFCESAVALARGAVASTVASDDVRCPIMTYAGTATNARPSAIKPARIALRRSREGCWPTSRGPPALGSG